MHSNSSTTQPHTIKRSTPHYIYTLLKRMEGDCGIDNLKATELRLGLPGSEAAAERPTRGTKRSKEGGLEGSNDQEITRVAKAQVVGWPPVRSCRKNSFRAKASSADVDGVGMYVKVRMDGAPYLRKIDLKVYKGYKELREGLEDLFKCFSLGELSGLEGCNDSDYAITYEDKDGDWMLVGDVPWGMFIPSCKRLRIMRGSEARGLGSNQ